MQRLMDETHRDPNAAEQEPKRVFVKSYGCQMNVYDAQRMTDALDARGYRETADVGSADLVILNTCHIREKASEKIFSELGKLILLKASLTICRPHLQRVWRREA